VNTQQKVAAVTAAVAVLATPVVVYFEGEVRHGYRDPVGIVTACVGHTATAELGKRYTAAECAALLKHDLAEHNAGLLGCIDRDMPDYVHAAFLSFAFNVGVTKTCKSTAATHLRAGRWTEACRELLRWTKAGGQELAGLVRRRQVEFQLCMGETHRVANLGARG
jgi:lysozyme